MTTGKSPDPFRIMIAGEFWHGATARGLAGGFRALGWDVAEVDILQFVLRGRGLLSRGAARLLWRNAIAEFNAEILRRAELNRIELFLTVKGVSITSRTVERLRAMGTRVVVFYPDVLFDHPGVDLAALAAADLIVTTKSYHAAWLDRMVGPGRHSFVHHGYCSDAHLPRYQDGVVPYRWDIGFIGNASPYKADHLAAVVRAFPDARIAIIGNGWDKVPLHTTLAPYVLGDALIGDYFSRALEQTRINLAVHHGPIGQDGWQDLTSTRTFEIPAVGGFMLHVDNAEVRALYEPGYEIGIFADIPSMIEQIGHYLTHEDERAAIAAAGHRRCVPAYSLERRAGEIAALLAERGLLTERRV